LLHETDFVLVLQLKLLDCVRNCNCHESWDLHCVGGSSINGIRDGDLAVATGVETCDGVPMGSKTVRKSDLCMILQK